MDSISPRLEPRLLKSELCLPLGLCRANNRWLSEQAVQPTTGKWNVLCTDFFTYSPEESYDVIFDYTYVSLLLVHTN
jgi:hypothetical protein